MKLVAALFAVMLLVFGASWLVSRRGGGGCSDVPLAEVASPGGRFVAARVAHRCGDADIATQVTLRRAGAAAADAAPIFAARGEWPVALEWRDGQTLSIESSGDNQLPSRSDAQGVSLLWRRIH